MPPSPYIKSELTGQVLAAQVLYEKVTERECAGIQTDLQEAAKTTSWRITLDMSKVMMLASAGLGMLINLHKHCTTGGGKLVIHGLSDELLDLMKLTKLNKLLTIADSKEAALKKASA